MPFHGLNCVFFVGSYTTQPCFWPAFAIRAIKLSGFVFGSIVGSFVSFYFIVMKSVLHSDFYLRAIVTKFASCSTKKKGPIHDY